MFVRVVASERETMCNCAQIQAGLCCCQARKWATVRSGGARASNIIAPQNRFVSAPRWQLGKKCS